MSSKRPEAALVPVLAGKYDAASGAWRGRWGMGSLEDFPPSADTSEFEYARRESSGRMLGGVYDGHFMVKQEPPEPPFQIVEVGVVIEFVVEKRDASSSSLQNHIEVIGSGSNKFGNYVLRGHFDPMTAELRVEKQYETPPKNTVQAGQITDAGLREDLEAEGKKGVVYDAKVLREWRKLQDTNAAGPKDNATCQVRVSSSPALATQKSELTVPQPLQSVPQPFQSASGFSDSPTAISPGAIFGIQAAASPFTANKAVAKSVACVAAPMMNQMSAAPLKAAPMSAAPIQSTPVNFAPKPSLPTPSLPRPSPKASAKPKKKTAKRPRQPVPAPVLEGLFEVKSGIWRGRWGMRVLSENELKHGCNSEAKESSEFEFKTQVQTTENGGSSGAVAGARGETMPPLPISGLYDGFFMVKVPPPDQPIRVDEKELRLEFKVDNCAQASPRGTAVGDSPASIEVTGSGQNIYGAFELRGWMTTTNATTREQGLWTLRMQKRYRKPPPKGVGGAVGEDAETAKRRKVQREMEKLRDACGTGHRYYSYTHDQQSRHPLKEQLSGIPPDSSGAEED
jgi:hypothetical protein